MNEITDPLDYLIQCCETAINTGKWKLTKFTILNAKDELKKLRQQVDESNQFKNVAWASINSRGDMFNLSMIYNQFANKDATIFLYRNEKEYNEKYGKLSK